MKFARHASGIIVLAYLTACSADPTGLTPTSTDLSIQSASPEEATIDFVTRAIAFGMKDQANRTAVRNAMRASLVTEHKLVLQDFAQTPAGRTLLMSGAQRLNVSFDSLENAITRLPALDFYVPSRDDRRSWRADAALRVGFVARQRGARFRAYDPGGGVVEIVTSIPRKEATFVLQPAERKSRRINPQPSGPGAVIEDLTDGGLSGSFVDYLPDGSTKVTDLADYVALTSGPALSASMTMSTSDGERAGFNPGGLRYNPLPCGENCGTGGGGGTVADTTFLWHLIIIDVCDNYNCNEGNEFEWHTYFSTNSGSTWGNRRDIRLEGIPSNVEYNELIYPALLKKIRASNEKITTDIVETDAISGSDHFEPSPVWSSTDIGSWKTAGDNRCGYPKYYGGTYECAQPPFYIVWKEVNQTMRARTAF